MNRTAIIIILLLIPLAAESAPDYLRIGSKRLNRTYYNEYYTVHNSLLINTDNSKLKTYSSMNFNRKTYPFHNVKKDSFKYYITTRIMVYEARKKIIKKDKDLARVIKYNVMKKKVTYYLQRKFRSKIKITDSELDTYYQKHKKEFNGVAITDEIIEIIRNRIHAKKFNGVVKKYINHYTKRNHKKINTYVTILTGKKYNRPIYPGGFKLTQKTFLNLYYKVIELDTGIKKEIIQKDTSVKKNESIKTFARNLITLCFLKTDIHKILSKRETKILKELTVYDTLFNWIIYKNITSKIRVTNSETIAVYNKIYKTELSTEQKKKAIALIQRQIFMIKMQKKSQKFLMKIKKETVLKGTIFNKKN